MSVSGDRPDPSRERIRPAPRPVRAAPGPEDPAVPGIPAYDQAAGPEPVSDEEEPVSILRPDRSRMDALSLDRSGARRQKKVFRDARKIRDRDRRHAGVDRWFFRLILAVLTMALLGVVWSILHPHLNPVAPPSPVTVPAAVVESGSARALQVLHDFLAAPDAVAKSAYVLDAGRVLPLMTAAYARGNLPESTVSFGVPQALETGLTMVPVKTADPPGLFFHLLVKEKEGRPRLDWETYEQELSGRFLAFAANSGSPGGDFRLILERTHTFGAGTGGEVAVRVAPPGSAALVQPVMVSPEAAKSVSSSLPWNARRRAFVKLVWETPKDAPARMVLQELVRWDFLP